MAIYHANVKTFSRAKGHSSIAAAAYRAGLLLEDAITGMRHDYRRRDGVVETLCIAPEGELSNLPTPGCWPWISLVKEGASPKPFQRAHCCWEWPHARNRQTPIRRKP